MKTSRTTLGRKRDVQGWHPASKLVLGVAAVALPYLGWTALGEAPAAVRPAAPPPAAVARAPAVVPASLPEPARMPSLPPLERFSAMLERPLFSPSRRAPLAPVSEPVTAETVMEAVLEQPPPATLRLVGTVVRQGVVTALVHHPSRGELVRLALGDRIDDWRVIEFRANALVLEDVHDRERLVLTMLE